MIAAAKHVFKVEFLNCSFRPLFLALSPRAVKRGFFENIAREITKTSPKRLTLKNSFFWLDKMALIHLLVYYHQLAYLLYTRRHAHVRLQYMSLLKSHVNLMSSAISL